MKFIFATNHFEADRLKVKFGLDRMSCPLLKDAEQLKLHYASEVYLAPGHRDNPKWPAVKDVAKQLGTVIFLELLVS